MAKKILDFDYQGYFNEMFETTTALMWSTRYEPYTFAYFLNKLYSIQLRRKDNIAIKIPNAHNVMIECVVYHYQSNSDHMAYLLIDSSNSVRDRLNNKKGTIFDKTLLLIGADSQELAKNIYDEMNSTPSFRDDILTPQNREETLCEFINNGILESVLFDFSNPDKLETTYFRNSLNNPGLESIRQKFLDEQRTFVTELMMALDHLLPVFEEA